MNDKMELLESLKQRIMAYGRVEDEQVAMDLARKWATA
mgnify:CR=1 FL=1|tara:strand:- start:169 stop:282 length:114 start_codon:yes stop_codon:yes gene_type:complete